jgi:hypothetical protein
MSKKPTQPTITTEINGLFNPEQEAALKGAAAAVAESDSAKDEALETFARILTPNPTIEIYTNGQKVFQAGYIAVMPDISPEALTKRTSRFFSELLKSYGMTKPKSHDPAAEKKAAQRAKAQAELVAKYANRKPEQIKEEIQQGYAKLAASVPDAAEVKKAVKEAETALRIMTKEETDKQSAALKALKSTLLEYVKKATDYEKIKKAILALK